LTADGSLPSYYSYLAYVGISSQTPLAPGASYTVTQDVTVPASTGPGSWYFVVATDRDGYQGESREDNNIRAASFTVRSPDLTIVATAPDAAPAGDVIDVSWTVTNQGSVPALASYWYDEVYLSTDQVLDTHDTWLWSDYLQRAPLAAGASYTV